MEIIIRIASAMKKMNILIICTYFPPDTAIAAVRPYMIAKHLSLKGHKVTVICSGIINRIADSDSYDLSNIDVIPCLNHNQNFDNKLNAENNSVKYIKKITPKKILKLLKGTRLLNSIGFYKYRKKILSREDRLINTIENIKNRNFDIVFSTYGEAENIIGGEYASKLFNAKWIVDLRDLVCDNYYNSFLKKQFLRKYEKVIFSNSNMITTVSDDMTKHIKEKTNIPVFTIYNGFDPSNEKIYNGENENSVFSICYTGNFYSLRMEALEVVLKAIRHLADNNSIDLDKIKITIAGAQNDSVAELFLKYNLSSVYNNAGYVDKKTVKIIQSNSDVILVLSWNLENSQGILTGKFCEAAGLHKPILSVVAGNKPESELYRLNKKYKYGFCFESANDKNGFYELCEWIKSKYNEKNINGKVVYNENKEFVNKFDYKNLTAELENIMLDSLGK